MARSSLAIEMNMVEFIKQQRYFSAAIRRLLSKEERLELKENTRYLTVDPETQIAKENLELAP